MNRIGSIQSPACARRGLPYLAEQSGAIIRTDDTFSGCAALFIVLDADPLVVVDVGVDDLIVS